MVAIEGGTQALKRTVNAVLDIRDDGATTISVPRPFAAVILKAAAYLTDSRDRDRHLFDAAALLACVEDPFAEAESPPVPTDAASAPSSIDCPTITRPGCPWTRQRDETPRRRLRILSSA